MPTKLQSIAEQLSEEHARLTKERNAVTENLVRIDGELKSVEQALAALKEKPKQAKAKTSKPAPKRDDVEQVAEQILSEQGALETEALKKEVGAKLAEAGYSKMGLTLRLKEVLGSDGFIDSPAGWKLVDDESEQTVEA